MEIRGINGIGNVNNDRLNKANNVSRATSAGSDNVEISEEAKKLSELASYQKIVEASPDIREDRIAEVKAKLESGAYDNDEVMLAVADKLMKVLGL